MINNIENIADLRNEISRLKELKEEQEKILKQDIISLQDALEPSNLVGEAATALFKGATKKTTLAGGLNLGIEYLTDKILLRKSNLFTKFIASILIRNVTKSFSKNKINWNTLITGIVNDITTSGTNEEASEEEDREVD